MNNDLRNHIYESFNDKVIDELVEIWTINDRAEWSELAFDVIKEILEQKLGKLPPQNDPIFKPVNKVVVDILNEDLPLDTISNTENAPEFYKPKEVLRINLWLNKIAKAAVVILILGGVPEISRMQQIIGSYLSSHQELIYISWIIALIVGSLALALQCFITYYSLKALATILSILMEMEFNSRVIKL